MKPIRMLFLLLVLLLCIGLFGCGAAEHSAGPVPIHSEAGVPAPSAPLASLHAEKGIPTAAQAPETESGAEEREEPTVFSGIPNPDGTRSSEEAQRTLPANTDQETTEAADPEEEGSYVLNTNTKKFHLPSCSSVKDIQKSNREERNCTAGELIRQGYQPCKRCNPAAAAAVDEKGNTTPGRSTPTPTEPKDPSGSKASYVVNTNTHKFHRPDCSSVKDIKQSNRLDYTGTREELIAEGYDPCKRCNP